MYWYLLSVSLGLDEADAQRQNLDVYKAHFQAPFLDATYKYYKAESDAFIANNSVADFMKKAEARLQEESERVNLYLHSSTAIDLKRQCEEALINAHNDIMWEEFQVLLDADRMDGECFSVRSFESKRIIVDDFVSCQIWQECTVCYHVLPSVSNPCGRNSKNTSNEQVSRLLRRLYRPLAQSMKLAKRKSLWVLAFTSLRSSKASEIQV